MLDLQCFFNFLCLSDSLQLAFISLWMENFTHAENSWPRWSLRALAGLTVHDSAKGSEWPGDSYKAPTAQGGGRRGAKDCHSIFGHLTGVPESSWCRLRPWILPEKKKKRVQTSCSPQPHRADKPRMSTEWRWDGVTRQVTGTGAPYVPMCQALCKLPS